MFFFFFKQITFIVAKQTDSLGYFWGIEILSPRTAEHCLNGHCYFCDVSFDLKKNGITTVGPLFGMWRTVPRGQTNQFHLDWWRLKDGDGRRDVTEA